MNRSSSDCFDQITQYASDAKHLAKNADYQRVESAVRQIELCVLEAKRLLVLEKKNKQEVGHSLAIEIPETLANIANKSTCQCGHLFAHHNYNCQTDVYWCGQGNCRCHFYASATSASQQPHAGDGESARA